MSITKANKCINLYLFFYANKNAVRGLDTAFTITEVIVYIHYNGGFWSH